MTDRDIRAALRKRYGDSRQYAIAEEVGLTTGYSRRRLDMVVLDCFDSHHFRIDGFEIKISTSDLRHELIDPDKHTAFFDIIDYYTIAAPAGVVDPVIDVMPKTWGILIVNEDGTTRIKRRPLALRGDDTERKSVPRGFMAGITRAIQQYQPSKEEINAAYKKGHNDGEESERMKAGYNRARLEREAKRLDEYDELCLRLGLFGDVNKALEQFEAFRKANPDNLVFWIDSVLKSLSMVKNILGGSE